MQNATLLVGTLAVACSLDHVRVATLDDAGSASSSSTGGELAGAGHSNRSASAGGNALASGGSPPQNGEDRFILISGGANGDVQISADAGAKSVVVCSCLGTQAEACGSDGVTYPAPCDDGGACLPPSIACFHACPCLDGETAGSETWFSLSPNCAPTVPCSEGLICLTLSSAPEGELSSCADAGN